MPSKISARVSTALLGPLTIICGDQSFSSAAWSCIASALPSAWPAIPQLAFCIYFLRMHSEIGASNESNRRARTSMDDYLMAEIEALKSPRKCAECKANDGLRSLHDPPPAWSGYSLIQCSLIRFHCTANHRMFSASSGTTGRKRTRAWVVESPDVPPT